MMHYCGEFGDQSWIYSVQQYCETWVGVIRSKNVNFMNISK